MKKELRKHFKKMRQLNPSSDDEFINRLEEERLNLNSNKSVMP